MDRDKEVRMKLSMSTPCRHIVRADIGTLVPNPGDWEKMNVNFAFRPLCLQERTLVPAE
jgi:hypothetical protein